VAIVDIANHISRQVQQGYGSLTWILFDSFGRNFTDTENITLDKSQANEHNSTGTWAVRRFLIGSVCDFSYVHPLPVASPTPRYV
jgi:hypothetical protein